MRRLLLPLLLITLAPGCGNPPLGPPPPTKPGEITLTQVKVADLNKEIASHRGKVVLIDCWFLRCAPCRKKFPRVVQLHREFAADGLVVMSLDVVPDEWKEKDEVVEFLKAQKADFPHYIFSDKYKDAAEAWTFKYDATITPQFVAFDRNGNWVPTPVTDIRPGMTADEREAAHAATDLAFVKKLLGK